MANYPDLPVQLRLVLVFRVVVAGALIAVIVASFLVGEERRPHIEMAPAPLALGLPSVPVASGALLSENGAVALLLRSSF
jgi:hypothetical protein